ncbi:unnamed protein product [Tuwongella immobilis]|uniref:Uncharacterized protein n=1 Tax=Tuwongella immobilis TaxID=692036 RepID=A0A6C2YKI1_9BACT|nr:unnamed protein product [Tuwongella immobilis]VTR99305.1 unnamed protein product [Tuwongella immobilis]
MGVIVEQLGDSGSLTILKELREEPAQRSDRLYLVWQLRIGGVGNRLPSGQFGPVEIVAHAGPNHKPRLPPHQRPTVAGRIKTIEVRAHRSERNRRDIHSRMGTKLSDELLKLRILKPVTRKSPRHRPPPASSTKLPSPSVQFIARFGLPIVGRWVGRARSELVITA